MLRFVPLTPELAERYYGEPLPWPARGQALMRGDQVVAVVGICEYQSIDMLFARADPDLWRKPPPIWFKRVIISGMRLIARMRNQNKPLYAHAVAEQENSALLLEHFGFEQVSGRLYQWP